MKRMQQLENMFKLKTVDQQQKYLAITLGLSGLAQVRLGNLMARRPVGWMSPTVPAPGPAKPQLKGL